MRLLAASFSQSSKLPLKEIEKLFRNPGPKAYHTKQRLRELYETLAAPRRRYRKQIVKFCLKNYDVVESVIEDEGAGQTKIQQNRYYRKATQIEVLNEFTECTEGTLYVPQSTMTFGSLDYPWALAFKCDVDLALRKTGKAEDGLIHYLQDAEEPITKVYLSTLYRELMEIRRKHPRGNETYKSKQRAREISKTLIQATGRLYKHVDSEADGRGRPLENTNSADLLSRTNDVEAIRWIKEQADLLDQDASFTSEDYRDPVLSHAISSHPETCKDLPPSISQIRKGARRDPFV